MQFLFISSQYKFGILLGQGESDPTTLTGGIVKMNPLLAPALVVSLEFDPRSLNITTLCVNGMFLKMRNEKM
jgi:hypothetical protein